MKRRRERPGVHTLPDSPDSPIYRDIADDIRASTGVDRLRKMADIAHADYWWYCCNITTLNTHIVRDPDHPRFETRWIEHPWLFDRCREIQQDIEGRVTNKFFNWPRFHYKTTVVTIHPIGWELIDDPTLTTIILTFKVDKVGDTMFGGLKEEWTTNPLYHEIWPEIWPKDSKDYTTFTGEAVKLPCTTAREPTVSVHSLSNMPTSFHVDRLRVDDAVVMETVSSAYLMDQIDESMKHITALQTERSTVWFIGTIWHEDDPYMRRIKSGMFTSRSHWTCYGLPEERENGVPCFQSGKMIGEWIRTMGPYVASCQLFGIPIARHDQRFMSEWMVRYQNDPALERQNKNVYIFVDFAGDGTGVDFWAAAVIGLGADRRLYALDLWREKIGLNAGTDQIFELHHFWQPESVFIEQFGAAGYEEAIRGEQERRGYRFKVQRLPKIHNRSKVGRIELLEQWMSQLRLYFPANGFGHGSQRDRRDTLDQFMQDEYSKWSPVKGSTLTDDMLDAFAWAVQPEVRPLMRYPDMGDPENPHDPILRRQKTREMDTNWAW